MIALQLVVVFLMAAAIWAFYLAGKGIWRPLREWIKFKRQTWGRQP